MTERKIIQEVRLMNEVAVVTLAGTLDVALQKILRDELERVAQEQGDLVLDLAQVAFIDSSCLGALVATAKMLREKQGDIKIAGLRDDVLSIFQITRLDRVFGIFDTVDEAAASYYK
jgi:anti-sigma B factor antagonist